MKTHDCCIIGGGITGIIAGRLLASAGKEIVILDKGRGRGGRLASRRIASRSGTEATIDYGLQYATFRGAETHEIKNTLLSGSIIKEWLPAADDYKTSKDHDPTPYIGVGGIRNIAKFLSSGIRYLNNKKVISLLRRGSHWEVKCEDNDLFFAEWVLLTPPVPQALELIRNSGVSLSAGIFRRLEGIGYERSIAVLTTLKRRSGLYDTGALSLKDQPIYWISDNQAKSISEIPSLTILAGNGPSLEMWNKPDEVIAEEIIGLANEHLSFDLDTYQIHKWRYSKPLVALENGCIKDSEPGNLIIAGDAFISPGFEGAVRSGIDAAEKILTGMNS